MRSILTAAAVSLACIFPTMAQETVAVESRLILIGKVAPKAADEIAANNWSIGTETIDRNFSNYTSWRGYLGPLGAKHARLQSGWARTEKQPGTYDFSWLDPIVDGMNADGVRPWFTLGYGNPGVPGGGTAQRDSDIPRGAARTAWLAYVRTIVIRYRGKVDYWELWNEPDLIDRYTAEEFADFAVETAKVVRGAQPGAIISIAGFTGVEGKSNSYAKKVLKRFGQADAKGLANVVGFHVYTDNPDRNFAAISAFRQQVKAIDPKLDIRQGESGAPSINSPLFALKNMWWTEEAQAKWVLRRMIGDAGLGVWTSVFTLTDLHYSTEAERNATFAASASQRTAAVALNTKGLLETRRYSNGPENDTQVVRSKMGYRAMQAVTSIFDARLQPITAKCSSTTDGVTVSPFRREDGAIAIALWRGTDRPGLRPQHEEVNVSCTGLRFVGDPVYVDLLTSTVYRTVGVAVDRGGSLELNAVPIYDAPVVVADTALVEVW